MGAQQTRGRSLRRDGVIPPYGVTGGRGAGIGAG